MLGFRLALLVAVSPCAAFPRGWANTILTDRSSNVPANAAARFSLYPRVSSDASLKVAIKTAVGDIGSLGLHVEADSVSSLIQGERNTVFDGLQGSLTRCASLPGQPHASMQFTISSAGFDETTVPAREANANEYASGPPVERVACHFNVYSLCELGTCEAAVQQEAADSPSFVMVKPLGIMLDGDSDEVFQVLRRCYMLAVSRSTSGHIVMTATLTANLSKWKANKR